MKKLLVLLFALGLAGSAFAQVQNGGGLTNGNSAVSSSNPLPVTAAASAAITWPSSTLTSGTATTLTTGQLIASSATAGSVVVPAYAIANSSGGALSPKGNLTTNATSGWGGVTLTVNEWTAAPTYTNGDGGAYAATTGSAALLDQLSCTFVQFVDKAQAVCTSNYSGPTIVKQVGSANIYWDLQTTGSVTKTSGQTFTFAPGLVN